jgi:CheY-like chemotaxis protein
MQALRVLVVEDDALIAGLLADIIADMGHEVCSIQTTETDAVDAANRFKPDLMIVDARLREGSGISAVAQILSTGFVAHVFVSGDPLKDQVLNPRAAVLQKPFTEPDLRRAIARAVGVGTSP